MTKKQAAIVEQLRKRISNAWISLPIDKAKQITEKALNLKCVTEEMHKAIYPAYVNTRAVREEMERVGR